jgi:hypothetical protein
VNKANSIMGLIRRTYTYLDEQSFKYLFQALVRPHIEYAEAVVVYRSSETSTNQSDVIIRSTESVSVKNTLGQNYQMFVTMRAKKPSWDKTAIFLSVWRQNKNKNNQRTKLSIYILDTIESESTTRFKNRSSDRMMTSD